MSQQYANDQPANFKNHISNVAIVGGGGQVGSFIVDELLKTGKITVTAISREDSSATFAKGVKVAKVNYEDPASVVAALKGQDALIITMAITAPQDTVNKLISAAAEADVAFILPNEWGLDPTETQLGKDTFLGPPRAEARKQIEALGKSSWIGLICSFWYEFSFAGGKGERYGFDVDDRKVTFYDDGNTKINTTTWPQTGRAVASLLTLPLLAKDANDRSLTLNSYKNKCCYIDSFDISQKDMFASVLRVTGTKESDWTIETEDVRERYARGSKEVQSENSAGFVILLYARVFYPDGSGNFGNRFGTSNKALGLPKEDLDEATKRALQWKKEGKI